MFSRIKRTLSAKRLTTKKKSLLCDTSARKSCRKDAKLKFKKCKGKKIKTDAKQKYCLKQNKKNRPKIKRSSKKERGRSKSAPKKIANSY